MPETVQVGTILVKESPEIITGRGVSWFGVADDERFGVVV